MTPHSYLVYDNSADGTQIDTALFEIRVGNSDRQWLQVHYIAKGIEPILHVPIIPAGPDDPNSILDACILFYPRLFRACPSFTAVWMKLRNSSPPVRVLDFHLDPILPEWFSLREEARPVARSLELYACELRKYELPV